MHNADVQRRRQVCLIKIMRETSRGALSTHPIRSPHSAASIQSPPTGPALHKRRRAHFAYLHGLVVGLLRRKPLEGLGAVARKPRGAVQQEGRLHQVWPQEVVAVGPRHRKVAKVRLAYLPRRGSLCGVLREGSTVGNAWGVVKGLFLDKANKHEFCERTLWRRSKQESAVPSLRSRVLQVPVPPPSDPRRTCDRGRQRAGCRVGSDHG